MEREVPALAWDRQNYFLVSIPPAFPDLVPSEAAGLIYRESFCTMVSTYKLHKLDTLSFVFRMKLQALNCHEQNHLRE